MSPLQEDMLSSKGAEKKALKRSAAELDEIIGNKKKLYDELKTKADDDLTPGMNIEQWRAENQEWLATQ